MTKFRWLVMGYILVTFGLLLYSFTQTDLNLTISSIPFLFHLQKLFQYIGYYQRPLSTGIFLFLLAGMFFLYGWTIKLVTHGLLAKRQIWALILCVTGILVFCYPAFSYDIFNYIFQAKLVVIYHKSPYIVTALTLFGFDPWVSFMRSIHLTSSYSPVWIGLTLLPYILGFEKLGLILFNFKLLLAGSYLITVWAIGEVLEKKDPKQATLGMVLFGLQPLVLIESVVSPHNDIAMMACCLFAWVLWSKKDLWNSHIFLALSVALKTMTFFLYPIVFLFEWNSMLSTLIMIAAIGLGVWRREPLSWYMLWVLPFVALQPNKKWLTISSGIVSLGFLLLYAPFLYYGSYDPPVDMIRNICLSGSVLIALMYICINFYLHRKTS